MLCPNCGAPLGLSAAGCERCDWNAGADLTRTGVGAHQCASAAAPGTLLPGETFTPRYTIIKLLGSGGMGEVYHAWDEVLGAPVALKVIRASVALDPFEAEALEGRFKRELLLARRVTHSNVVRIHDLGDVGGQKYLTMEFVQGTDLGFLLRRHGKLPIARALSIGRQILDGLRAVHRVGIVHRDLKPANVIVDAEDRALLTDFGIARSIDAKTQYTLPGAIMGTLKYMSPEQARGEQADQRSDIYAFGLILSEMLAGGLPQTGTDDPLASLIGRIEHRPPPLGSINPDVPPDTERLVARCLESNPAKRYQTIDELLADFDKLGSDGRQRIQSTTPRGGVPTLLVLAGLLAGVLVGLGFVSLRLLRMPGTPAPTPNPITVLISDFENSADPIFDGSLEQPLGIAIENASFITAYPRKDAMEIARQLGRGPALTEETARLVAQREGVPVIIADGVTREGTGYRLTAKAVNTTSGSVISQASVDAADKAGVLQAVGRAAQSLRRALGDTPVAGDLRGETFSTASLQAVKYYTDAQALSADRQNSEAIELYRRALAEDPNFGRAYAGWASAALDSGRLEEARQQWQNTLKYVDRMTERERLRTLGVYYLGFAHNNEKALETFSTLVQKYPGDFAGHNNLAIAQFLVLNFQAARKEGERAIELYPRSLKFLGNYALYAMYAGDFASGAAKAGDLLKKQPGYADAYLPLAMDSLARGDTAGARAVYAQARAMAGDGGASLAAIGLADIALLSGRPDEAVTILEPAIAADREQKNIVGAAAKTIALAEAYSAAGRQAAMIKTIDKALAMEREDSILVVAARLLLGAGQDGRAQTLTRELGDRLQPQSRAYAKVLEAEGAIARNRPGDALQALADAKKLADLWLVHLVSAEAYQRAGHDLEARDERDKCLKRIGEATALFLDDQPTFRYTASLRALAQSAERGAAAARPLR
jgi:eukaryotic-like serine/threonine-protein kinase